MKSLQRARSLSVQKCLLHECSKRNGRWSSVCEWRGQSKWPDRIARFESGARQIMNSNSDWISEEEQNAINWLFLDFLSIKLHFATCNNKSIKQVTEKRSESSESRAQSRVASIWSELAWLANTKRTNLELPKFSKFSKVSSLLSFVKLRQSEAF